MVNLKIVYMGVSLLYDIKDKKKQLCEPLNLTAKVTVKDNGGILYCMLYCIGYTIILLEVTNLFASLS